MVARLWPGTSGCAVVIGAHMGMRANEGTRARVNGGIDGTTPRGWNQLLSLKKIIGKITKLKLFSFLPVLVLISNVAIGRGSLYAHLCMCISAFDCVCSYTLGVMTHFSKYTAKKTY